SCRRREICFFQFSEKSRSLAALGMTRVSGAERPAHPTKALQATCSRSYEQKLRVGPAKRKRAVVRYGFALRILITVVALGVWFWTQSLLGARISPAEPIGDELHKLTAPLNAYFQSAPRAANALLIVSSALIDAIGIFLIASWVFAGRLRPFLGLAILLATRQVMQALCSLPAPAGIIWHYPGFPSLLVTYSVAND